MLDSWFLLYAILSSFAGVAWGVQVACGTQHTCAIVGEGRLKCWGDNAFGQIGIGKDSLRADSPFFVDMPGNLTVTSIALGSLHTCAVLADASLWCWGDNVWGQLGDETTDRKYAPTAVSTLGPGTTSSVACGLYFTCAILKGDGSVKCWGYNSEGQLGQGTSTGFSTVPIALDIGSGRTALNITTGYVHACVILDDRSVKCWGRNTEGQVGNYGPAVVSTPTAIDVGGAADDRLVSNITAGGYSTCAIRVGGTVMCWGENDSGQLGIDAIDQQEHTDKVNRDVPTLSAASDLVTQISMGSAGTACAVLKNGKADCWGAYISDIGGTNWNHQGSGTRRRLLFFAQVEIQYSEHGKPVSVSVGGGHACVVLEDDSIWCWGRDDAGQVGDGSGSQTGNGYFPKMVTCGTNKYAGSTSCTNCPSGKVKPAGDAVFGSYTGACNLPPSPAPVPQSERECGSVAPTSYSLLTDSCAACFAGFYTSNSSVYYDCGTSWIYYFSPKYVTFEGSQPTWNGGAYLHHNYGRSDSPGSWLYSSSWMYAASATFKGFDCTTGDLSGGLTPSSFAGIEAAAVYDRNVDGGTWQYSSGGGDYGTNQWVMDNLCAPACACATPEPTPEPPPTPSEASLPPPPPPPPPPSASTPAAKKKAAETREKAEKTRDAMLTGVTNAKLKKKAKLLADAAISGKKVKKMSAKLTAADEDTACSDYYTKAGLSSSLGACIATAASRRRSLAATTYDVSVFFSEAEVDDATLTAAENSLKAEGVTGVETSDPIDPIAELGTIDGVDTSTLESFKTEAAAAAATMPPSPPPPPISRPPPGPPVPNLIQDDEDHASTNRGLFILLTVTALNFLL